MKVTLELDEKQLIALGMLMGIGKRASEEHGPVHGLWKFLRPINEQLRAQVVQGKAAEIFSLVEEEN